MGVGAAVLALTAASTAYSASEARKSRESQAAAQAKAEAEARRVQEEQAALASEEEAAAAEKLKEQQARLIRGRKGRGGLLFGSELGVEETDKAATLGG